MQPLRRRLPLWLGKLAKWWWGRWTTFWSQATSNLWFLHAQIPPSALMQVKIPLLFLEHGSEDELVVVGQFSLLFIGFRSYKVSFHKFYKDEQKIQLNFNRTNTAFLSELRFYGLEFMTHKRTAWKDSNWSEFCETFQRTFWKMRVKFTAWDDLHDCNLHNCKKQLSRIFIPKKV